MDAGDLFFKKYSAPYREGDSQRLKEKAYLILKSFELMGYQAIGIGDDDLSLGKEFLIELSKRSPLPFLSSNVMDKDSGKTLFQRSVIKELNGLRIGIFSLLSPDVFLGPADPRKNGLSFRDPLETARELVRELSPKTDLIVLLSHQGYPKDVELTQKISGIHIIVGGHSGVHLTEPPVFKDTLILQTSSKGMYGAKLDLTLINKKTSFYNITTKRSLEKNLNKLKLQLASGKASEEERDRWRRVMENTEKALQQLEGKNYFANAFIPLNETIKDHPEIKKMVDEYKSKFPERIEPTPHDSRGVDRPKP